MTMIEGPEAQPVVDDLPDPSVRPAHIAQSAVGGPERSSGFALPSILDVVGVVAMVVGAALPLVLWGRIFADSGHVLPVVVASVGGALVALSMFGTRRTTGVSFVVLLVGVIIGLLARYNSAVADLPGDVIESWKSLASTGLLIPSSKSFLIPPIVVTAFASWAAVTVVLRQRSAILVAVPLLLAVAVALAYTVSLGGLPWWFVSALVAVIGIALVVGGLRRPGGAAFADDASSTPLRQIVVGAGLVGVLAVGAGALSSLVGDVGDKAFDLRSVLVRPLAIYEDATPLASVKSGLVADVPANVFTIELQDLPPDTEVKLIPVATLDAYDGSVWSTTAQFEPAGSQLPSPEQVAGVGPGSITQIVDLDAAYPFRFLPRAGIVRNLSGDGLAWDPRSGTVASVDRSTQTYRSVIDLAPDRPDDLTSPGEVPESLRYASERPETTAGQAEVLVGYAQSVVTADDPVEERLAQFETDLRGTSFGYNEEAPAGHSLAALTSYLRPEPDPDEPDAADPNAPGPNAIDPNAMVSRIGFSEQSASVFAVLAREMGLASRVVVGYRLDEPLTAENPKQVVNEGQIHAWPEVWFDGLGWVGFDPTNTENTSDELSARTPAVSSSGQDAAQGQLPEFQDPVLLPPEGDTDDRSPLWWLLLLPLLPLLYAGVIVVTKQLRRSRRRRRVDPDRQVVGAWREVRDRFGELGLPAPRSSSALDLAEYLEVNDLRDLAEPVGDLAPLIDDALYAPTPVTEAQATAAWDLSSRAIKLARKQAGVKQRIAAVLDPRSLFS